MAKTIHIALLLSSLIAGVGSGADQYVRIERLSPRVLLAYWIGTGRCNLTAIQTQKGLVIVDTEMSPGIMAPIKTRIEREFGRSDWAYVINTHGHMHHAGGNCLFTDATIVGHENLPEDMQWLIDRQTDPDRKRRELNHVARTLRTLQENMRQFGGRRVYARMIRGETRFWELFRQDMQEGHEIVKPTLTFADRHTLDMGDVTLELVFFGRGHSQSDILVYIPQEKLLVTGAIAYQRNHLPEIGEQSTMADAQRFLAVLDEFLRPELPIRRIVPSHSPPLSKSDLVPIRAYYQKMLAGVRAAQREGLTLEQATERLAQQRAFPAYLEPPPGHWAYGMHRRNLRNLWRICEEETQLNTTQAKD